MVACLPTRKFLFSDMAKEIRFIDLFAGIGGIRTGLSQALEEAGYIPKCVMTSEIKPYAIKVLQDNYEQDNIVGDITQVDAASIPDFDILCGGFPCQAFSSAGKRQGFADTRGTLFFEVERILREKKPKGFILENVEGLVNHDGGKTLEVILSKLIELGYLINFKVLNSLNFGVPQDRKRIYIVGSFNDTPNLENFEKSSKKVGEILESGHPTERSPFIETLLSHFSVEELYGKSIKDKRGGETNIHSWDLEMKGPVSKEQKDLLNMILRERRKKKWAEQIGIDWMDGMPLTYAHIYSFFPHPKLQEMLDDLTEKGYIKFEHPKRKITYTDIFGTTITKRQHDTTLPKGYNIVAGKLSFPISKVMGPQEIAPTLVAMDMQKLYVADNKGLRKLTLREGLRLFGYPESMKLNVSIKDGYDLLGNTVVVPVIKAVATRLINAIKFD